MQTSPSASSTPSPSISIHDPNSKPEFDPELLLSHKFADWLFRYSARDVALYNLSIGACGDFSTYTKELKYVYHEQGQQLIEVLPTFAALLTVRVYPIVAKMPGMKGFEKQIQHEGHWYIEPYRPIPSIATLRNTITISALHDKGTDALLEIENKSFNEASGELLFMNRFSLTILGAGGFSKSSEPYSFYAYPDHPSYLDIDIPDWDPFCTFEDRTQPSQALLYRLSGDYNPLYADPAVAEAEGFVGPILHELCTLGFAVRAIITRGCLKHDSLIRNISGQAISPVYPGETLITELWCIDTSGRVTYQTKVKERNIPVLSGCVYLWTGPH